MEIIEKLQIYFDNLAGTIAGEEIEFWFDRCLQKIYTR